MPTTTAATKARAVPAAAAAPPPATSSSSTALPLLVVGSINQDVVLKVERLPAPGETLAASSMEMFPGGKVRSVSPFLFSFFFGGGRERRNDADIDGARVFAAAGTTLAQKLKALKSLMIGWCNEKR